jgi:hypothetical protein
MRLTVIIITRALPLKAHNPRPVIATPRPAPVIATPLKKGGSNLYFSCMGVPSPRLPPRVSRDFAPGNGKPAPRVANTNALSNR